jgi:hypothetical protein
MNTVGLAKCVLAAAAGFAVYIGSAILMVYRSVVPLPGSIASATAHLDQELITALWWVGGTALPVFLVVLTASLMLARLLGFSRQTVTWYSAGFLLCFSVLTLRVIASAPTGELVSALTTLFAASPTQFIVSASPFAGVLLAFALRARLRLASARSVA